MAKTLAEEPQGSEEETPSEAVTFHVSVLALCCLAMALLFSVKSPWYVRGLFSLFLFLLCFITPSTLNLRHLSLMTLQTTPMNNTPQTTITNKHPTIYTHNYFFFP